MLFSLNSWKTLCEQNKIMIKTFAISVKLLLCGSHEPPNFCRSRCDFRVGHVLLFYWSPYSRDVNLQIRVHQTWILLCSFLVYGVHMCMNGSQKSNCLIVLVLQFFSLQDVIFFSKKYLNVNFFFSIFFSSTFFSLQNFFYLKVMMSQSTMTS